MHFFCRRKPNRQFRNIICLLKLAVIYQNAGYTFPLVTLGGPT